MHSFLIRSNLSSGKGSWRPRLGGPAKRELGTGIEILLRVTGLRQPGSMCIIPLRDPRESGEGMGVREKSIETLCLD
jgi:hypothetical protein